MTERSAITEAEPHLHSGLRTYGKRVPLATDILRFTAAVAVVDAPTTWVNIPVTGRRCSPQTVVMDLFQFDIPDVGNIRFRVTGYNQFDEQVVETTPWGAFVAKAHCYFYLASVFRIVTKVEVQLDGPGISTTSLSCGVKPDFARVIDAGNEHIWGNNFGVGLSLRAGMLPRQKFVKGATAAADAYISDSLFEVPVFGILNMTSGVIWRIGDNMIVGRNVASFPNERNKVTITTFANVVNEISGAAVTQAATDVLLADIDQHTTLQQLGGTFVNDTPVTQGS